MPRPVHDRERFAPIDVRGQVSTRWAGWVGVAIGGVALALGAAAGLRAVRVLRAEGSCFRPRRGPVEIPASLAALDPRDASFDTADGNRIRGWYFPSKNGAAIVFVHGSSANRTQLAPEVESLVGEGFGALAIDLPGHGESDGRVTFGRADREAIRAAVGYVGMQAGVDPARIGALGLSIGAAILAAASPEERRLRAMVLVSPFADSEEQTRAVFAPGGPAALWTALAVDRHYMTDGPLRPVDAVGLLDGRAILVVAVADDTVVPVWMTEKVYEAANADKELCVVPSGGHANVTILASGVCAQRINAFYRRTLLGAK